MIVPGSSWQSPSAIDSFSTQRYPNIDLYMLYHWYWALFIHKYSTVNYQSTITHTLTHTHTHTYTLTHTHRHTHTHTHTHIYIYIYIYISVRWILPKELAIRGTVYTRIRSKEINCDGSFYVSTWLSAWPSLLITAPGTFSLPESQSDYTP